jgi:hypothetical protein
LVVLQVTQPLLARLLERDVRRLDVHERIIAGKDRREARLGCALVR